jgi:predicted aspartyl protease
MPIFQIQIAGQGKTPDGKVLAVPPAVALQQRGPVIPVSLTIEQNMGKTLSQQGKTVPTKQGVALIDTGASRSAIDEQVAKDLGLPIVNVAKMTSASHEEHPCNLYPVQFSILPNIVFQSPQTVGAKLATQGFVAIIGRDVLQKCVLIYNGGSGQITLCL